MEEYKTSNMYLAAVLVSYGAEIESVDRTNPRRLSWNFCSIPKHVYLLDNEIMLKRMVSSVEEIRAVMASNKMLFPPSFLSAIDQVKSYLYPE